MKKMSGNKLKVIVEILVHNHKRCDNNCRYLNIEGPLQDRYNERIYEACCHLFPDRTLRWNPRCQKNGYERHPECIRNELNNK